MSGSLEVAGRFAGNLVHARKRAGLSQEELGLRASLHRTEISLLERGTRVPQLDTLVKLAGGLDVAPEELLDGIVWRPGYAQVGGFAVDEPRKDE
jgi:transcriptional regulator with XRE-family HTH domain